ncbi:MAG: hypothetical protein ACK4NA_16850 [Alphaproteobacteria bacterium]
MSGEETGKAMSLRRLIELLDAYGASPQRWPAAERGEAQALIARIEALGAPEERAALRAAIDDADTLDGALAGAFAPVPDAALARLTAAVAFPPPRAKPSRRFDPFAVLGSMFGSLFKPAAALGAAMAALGLFVGFAVDPAYSNGDGSDYTVSQSADAGFGPPGEGSLGQGENGQ